MNISKAVSLLIKKVVYPQYEKEQVLKEFQNIVKMASEKKYKEDLSDMYESLILMNQCLRCLLKEGQEGTFDLNELELGGN